MSKIAKIYCSEAELPALVPQAKLIEPYDAFQLVSISAANLRKIAARVPAEDITKLYQVKMAGRPIDTKVQRYSSTGRTLSHAAYRGAASLVKGPHHYLVQFVGPVKDAWISKVKSVGGSYRSPYADFTCIFRLTDAALANVRNLPFVRWVGHLKPESRVADDVLKRRRRIKKGASAYLGEAAVQLRETLVIQFFDRKDMSAARGKIADCGASLISSDPSGLAIVEVPTEAAKRKDVVSALSELHGVRLITAKTVPSKRNNLAVQFMGTTRAAAGNGLGLTGTGEIVAIADTGIDTGVIQTVKADFAGRVQAIHSWPIDAAYDSYVNNPGGDDGAADVGSGHGTHVAGSAVGCGSQGPGNAQEIRGLARDAALIFQAVEQRMDFASAAVAHEFGDDPLQLVGIPSNVSKLFKQAYDEGARIHSNSWGGGRAGDYNENSRRLDEFVWEHPDFCVLVAAGNSGADPSPGADGVVDEGSVDSPGTAKNCITVGASESERASFAGLTYDAFNDPNRPPVFAHPTLSNDAVANNQDHMAAFSSRGPTLDGRIKPDVVAPGTCILSTRSSQIAPQEQGWGPYAENPGYMFNGGTSMATPLTAGAVALVRQFFRTKLNVPSPSAALLKATLICGAERMALHYTPAGVVADIHQGYGRINLDRTLAPAGGAAFDFRDATPGLRTGEQFEFVVNAAAARPLRVILAYSDYPGKGLKNNLNLVLLAPDGSQFVGNANGTSLTFDSKNNVEAVEIATPAAGAWRIRVVGGNVPKGPQPFAIALLR